MATAYKKKREEALKFIQEIHAGQTRAGGNEPAWHHLDRVSRILETVLNDFAEGKVFERELISLSGMGHDSFEDTSVSREKIVHYFSEAGTQLIEGMTNRFGDAHPMPYVKQVVAASEGVRLIKLADLYDNCTSVHHTLFLLGVPWTKDFFLPIVRPMIKRLLPTTFSTYQRSAERLKFMVKFSFLALQMGVKRYEKSLII